MGVARATFVLAVAALAAWELYSLPHLAFHLDHLSPYSGADATANVISLAATVVLPVVGFVLVRAAWADPDVTPAGTAP